MQVSTEKVQEAIDALHAAEKALMESGPASNGTLAARCLIAASALEVMLNRLIDPFEFALDALHEYQSNWDTGLPAEYAQSERIAMECAVEAVRDALYEARESHRVVHFTGVQS